ncbi:MAG: glycoside hydrolase 43 family protein [Opitutaceae bacterium]
MNSHPPSPAATDFAPWHSDQGHDEFRNPVLFLDFPDPDGIRVGDEYFLVCSTFAHEPGLLLLRSRDLVNWRAVGHALPRLAPAEFFAHPRRGCGVWAPALRHHAGRFWIFFPDPDFGIYVTTAEDFAGPWSPPVLVKAGKGLIDPCPLWDDDGSAYLIHGWAKSRSGINNVLTLHRLQPDASGVLDAGKVIIDGAAFPGCHTLEGPKLYKRAGWYYVFAPAGGVATGWQSVFRSRSIWGPYEERRVLAQGATPINGPHQGAWIETAAGDSWFLHFQDRAVFGRILHLQPMRWREDGWPVIGAAAADALCGEPVLRHAKPVICGDVTPSAPFPASDDFAGATLGLQWQWEARHEPHWYSLTALPGTLRLFTQKASSLWDAPNVLTQRVLGPRSTVATALTFAPAAVGERAGLVVMGRDYTWIGLQQTPHGVRVVRGTCPRADTGNREEVLEFGPFVASGHVQVRVQVAEGAPWEIGYSLDAGATWTPLGAAFAAREGIWVGARLGLFALAPENASAVGHVDLPWWRVTA